MMDRDRIEAELLEIQSLLLDDRLKDEDRAALHGAQQALRSVLDPETWATASQTFYRVGARQRQGARASSDLVDSNPASIILTERQGGGPAISIEIGLIEGKVKLRCPLFAVLFPKRSFALLEFGQWQHPTGDDLLAAWLDQCVPPSLTLLSLSVDL